MAEFSELIARGGGARLAFGLVIEGVGAFVSDASRSYQGRNPWSPDQFAAYEGLDASEITTEESADFLGAELNAGGLTLVIRDTHNDIATATFGSARPSRRTFLAADLTSSATTVTVVDTAGWPDAGYLHIGREAIRYTGKTATTFTGCTRAALGTLACAHDLEIVGPSGVAIPDIGVTDKPITVMERRAQLYVFIDDVASASGDAIWRGFVKGVESTADLSGYQVTLAHVSCLLDQEFGSKLRPFGLRGFYFSDEDPFELVIAEHASAYFGSAPAHVFDLVLTGFYETLDQLRDAVTTALGASANWHTIGTGATALPENDDYTCVLFDGSLAVQLRTGSPAYWVTIVRCHPLVVGELPSGDFGGSWMQTMETPTPGGDVFGVSANTTYVLAPKQPKPAPLAYARVGRNATRGVGVEAPEYPPNRVYYQGDIDGDSVTSFEATLGDRSRGTFTVATHVGASDYFTVTLAVSTHGPPMGGDGALLVTEASGITLVSTPENRLTFAPVLTLGALRWDELLSDLIVLTPTSGASGTTPWLPSAEFNTTDIRAQTLAASGAEFVKHWEIRKPTKLRDLLGPELQILGLCWTSSYGSTLTVRKIEVTTASTATAFDLSDRSADPRDRRQAVGAGVIEQRDGIVNTALVRFGYDAKSEEYADVHIAAHMRDSAQHFGEHSITIEPIGEEIPTSDTIIAALRDSLRASALVATHSYPYAHVTLSQIPGAHLFGVILGDIVSITDRRIPFNGRRGLESQRGQVVGKVVRWTGAGAPSVDLTVRLAEFNAGGYAPSARVYYSSPLGVSNTRIRMRAENWDSDAPTSGTRYDYAHFRVGDRITIHQEDTSTAATQEVTITRIDTTSHYLYVDPAVTLSMNTAGTIWAVKFSDYDTADNEPDSPAPAQRAYCFIADDSYRLGLDEDDAKLFAA